MTAFRYRAVRGDGARVAGLLDSHDAQAVVAQLSGWGLVPVEVQEVEAAHQLRARLPRAEAAEALAGLAALLEAGLPLDRALAAAEEGAGQPVARQLGAARARVAQGTSLSAAFAEPGAWPAPVVGLLRAGERSGHLGAAVQRASELLGDEAEVRARLWAALAYPAVLGAAGAVSVLVVLGVVVPRFAALLGDLGQALPASTRALLAASQLVARHWAPAAGAAAVLMLGVHHWAGTTRGRAVVHGWLLSLPVMGSLRAAMGSARGCRVLGDLLGAGVPLLAALDASADAAGDDELRRRLHRARDDVAEGSPLAVALRRRRALTPRALRLADYGERSGQLSRFLLHAARLDDAAAQRAIRALVRLLEPALVVGFGAIVAFVAAALLQAVYSVRPGGF